jgi:hypothetical protein
MSSDEDFKSNNPNEEGVDSENTDSNVPVEEPTTPVVTPPEETPPTPPEETPPTPPEEPPYSKVEEELKRAAESAEALRLAAEKEREERLEVLKKEREVIHAEAQALTDEINVKEEKERDAVVAKRDSFASTMANLELPEPGELVRLRKRFHKTILSVIGISLFLWLAYFLITTFLPFAWVIQLTSLGSTIFRYVLGAALLTVFSALVLYYRDWRRFDWKVKSLIKKLENIAKGFDKVRQEEVRLFSLYPQVVDWLEILGYSLNRPWTMNDRWFKSYLSDLNQDEFPFSLRIAQAQESDVSSMNKLQGRAMKSFAIRGWRSKVLKDQVTAIAHTVGLPSERMNVDGLDADIAYSPGGPRSEMRKGLENQDALELVARRQLVPLTFKVQSEGITKSRPPVKENRTNVLDPIQADQAGLEEEERVDWDDFLREPIGPFNGLVTPFSIASLTQGQVGYGYHEKMKSHFVVPERLEGDSKKNPDARVETYPETANLPMDIVIRMDLSDPMPPKAIKINSKAEQVDPSPQEDETTSGRRPQDDEEED